MARGVVSRGKGFKAIAAKVSPSTKTPKPKATGIFGKASQFAGIGRGIKGNLNK